MECTNRTDNKLLLENESLKKRLKEAESEIESLRSQINSLALTYTDASKKSAEENKRLHLHLKKQFEENLKLKDIISNNIK